MCINSSTDIATLVSLAQVWISFHSTIHILTIIQYFQNVIFRSLYTFHKMHVIYVNYISNIYIFEIYQNINIIGARLECSRYRHARTNSVNTKFCTISWGEEFFYEWPKVISKVYDYKQSFFNYIYLEYITIVKRLIHLIAISLFNHHLI